MAGRCLNDIETVGVLTNSARPAIESLQEHGLGFDHLDGTPQQCLEGGRSRPRILHAVGEGTGLAILRALVSKVRTVTKIDCKEKAEAIELRITNGCVSGVQLENEDGTREALCASAVVLASGDRGGLFEWSTNPAESDGSELALEMRAGSRQPLVSEPDRGAGPVLVNKAGQLLMYGQRALEGWPPPEVVARCIIQVRIDVRETVLHAPWIGRTWLECLPTVFAACVGTGIDPRLEPIPIVPAAHFHMRGISTDTDGRTSRPRLFVVGEVACNRVHGANALGRTRIGRHCRRTTQCGRHSQRYWRRKAERYFRGGTAE